MIHVSCGREPGDQHVFTRGYTFRVVDGPQYPRLHIYDKDAKLIAVFQAWCGVWYVTGNSA